MIFSFMNNEYEQKFPRMNALEDISMVDRINYQPNMMQLVILHYMYIVFCHSDVMVCLLIADSIAPQF